MSDDVKRLAAEFAALPEFERGQVASYVSNRMECLIVGDAEGNEPQPEVIACCLVEFVGETELPNG